MHRVRRARRALIASLVALVALVVGAIPAYANGVNYSRFCQATGLYKAGWNVSSGYDSLEDVGNGSGGPNAWTFHPSSGNFYAYSSQQPWRIRYYDPNGNVSYAYFGQPVASCA